MIEALKLAFNFIIKLLPYAVVLLNNQNVYKLIIVVIRIRLLSTFVHYYDLKPSVAVEYVIKLTSFNDKL